MRIYLVGGAVRDRLLGLTAKERDHVVVGATADELLRAGYKQVGADFPVFLHPETGEEYALARTERKTGAGYHGFETRFSPDVRLEEDLARRDLTINAMATDATGALIDPHGGQRDIEARVLRHVSAAFVEDPVRILRVGRFAARFHHLGFRVAGQTVSLMRRMVTSGEVDALVPERVWREFERALAEPSPQVFIEVLRQCGALARLFPEIDRLFGVPQPANHHPEVDTGVHILMVLRQAARLTDDPVTRFAALVHDLGKGTTPTALLPRHLGHERRSVDLIKTLCARLKISNAYRDLAVSVARYHGMCHTIAELRPLTIVRLLEGVDAYRRPGRLDRFLLACEADHRGRAGLEDRPYPQAELLRKCFQTTAAISAADLASGPLTGRAIGEAIRRLRVAAVRDLLAASK